jgi:voltage-dependent potassium channel beta subunit
MSLLNADGNPMRYNNLGESGLMVSEVSFGTMTFSDVDQAATGNGIGISSSEDAFIMMEACFRGGINFFDCAEGYGYAGAAERVLGDAIQLGLARGTWDRMDLVISTKLHNGGRGDRDSINSIGLSRKHLVEGMKASLARLQLDYVDLVFCHRPDPTTPMVEVVRAMNFLIDQGLAFYWGTSEWSAQMIEEARGIAREGGPQMAPPIFEQVSYSMLLRDRVEIEHQRLYPQLGLTAFAPLQGGLLTGKYSSDPTTWPAEWRRAGRGDVQIESVKTAEALGPIAKALGCSIAQLAMAWCLTNQNVSTCLMGASRLSQVQDNIGACRVARQLEGEGGAAVLAQIEELLGNTPEPPRGAMASDYRVPVLRQSSRL